MKKKRKYWVIAVLVGLVLFQSYQRLSGRKQKKESVLIPVTVQTVGRANLSESVSFSGTIEPNQSIPVFSRVSGKLEGVFFQEGDRVEKGAVLAKVEERDYQLRLSEAEAALKSARVDLANAESSYQRMEKLFKEEVITSQEMDNVRARRDAGQATSERFKSQSDLAREQLSDCRIIAPFSGFVGKRYLDPGIFITPAAGPILDLVELSFVKVKVPIGETELARIHPGQQIKIKPDAFPESTFTGNVSRINPVLDPSTRTTTLEMRISNPGLRLKSGMFVRADILMGIRKNVLTIPQEALSRQGNKTYVFVIKDGVVHQKEIILGIQEENRYEVLSGLSEGESVADAGIDTLFEGMGVAVTKSP